MSWGGETYFGFTRYQTKNPRFSSPLNSKCTALEINYCVVLQCLEINKHVPPGFSFPSTGTDLKVGLSPFLFNYCFCHP
jgi:hypothetical protein